MDFTEESIESSIKWISIGENSPQEGFSSGYKLGFAFQKAMGVDLIYMPENLRGEGDAYFLAADAEHTPEDTKVILANKFRIQIIDAIENNKGASMRDYSAEIDTLEEMDTRALVEHLDYICGIIHNHNKSTSMPTKGALGVLQK